MSDVNELVIECVFDAPVEKVWKAWSNPEEIKKWWGPNHFTAPVAEVDFREGGKYLLAMHGPAGTEFDKDMFSTGVYTEIVPMQKIVYTDSFADENGKPVSAKYYGMPGDLPMEFTVTLIFEPLDGKTKLTLTHEGMPAGPNQEGAMAGWNESLDKLAASL